MIAAIDGVPDTMVRLMNERLIELLGSEERVNRYLRVPGMVKLISHALRTGKILQLREHALGWHTCVRSVQKDSKDNQ